MPQDCQQWRTFWDFRITDFRHRLAQKDNPKQSAPDHEKGLALLLSKNIIHPAKKNFLLTSVVKPIRSIYLQMTLLQAFFWANL